MITQIEVEMLCNAHLKLKELREAKKKQNEALLKLIYACKYQGVTDLRNSMREGK